MIMTAPRWITVLVLLVAVAVYVILGKWPESVTTTISIALLICGLILLYLVNVFVSKRTGGEILRDGVQAASAGEEKDSHQAGKRTLAPPD